MRLNEQDRRKKAPAQGQGAAGLANSDKQHTLREAVVINGVGVHSGLSIVGTIGPPGQTSIQFLGDTGNVAARLEALTKEMNCTAIASQASLDAAELAAPGAAKVDLDIRGRDGQPVAAHLIRERAELMRLAGAQADVKMRATA